MARIVVVDDAEDITEFISEVLQDTGHTVVVCNQGGDALRCIIEGHPDLVLLDIRFEGMTETGWDILARLHEHPLTERLPVIVTSAALDDLRAHDAWLQHRGISVLAKPFDLDELLDLVESSLSGPESPAAREA
jgi:CheY-like chemotaxis protein